MSRPLTKAISGVLFSGFISSRNGFDFGFLIRWIYPQIRRSYYLFFNYLYGYAFWSYFKWGGYAFWSYWSGRGVCVLVVDNCSESHKPVEISDLRLLTIQERGTYLESNAAQ